MSTVSQFYEINLEEWVSEIIKKKLEIKLSDKEIEFIIYHLPEFPKLRDYKAIWQIGPGKHSPCIHEIMPEITKGTPIKNSCTGETAQFYYNNKKDALQLVEKINEKYGEFGYKAEIVKKFIKITTSEFTSISRVLADQSFVPLFCLHSKNDEIVFFAEPYGLNNYNLRKIFKEMQDKFYEKFNKTLYLPKAQKKKKCGNIKLPDFKIYNPDFIEFIIKHKPNEPQLKTYIALYTIAEIGIPIHLINKRNLSKLISKYASMSKRTVDNHIIIREPLLQNQLVSEIYIHPKSNISTKLKSKYLDNISSEIADHIDTSLPEQLNHEKKKKSKHNKKKSKMVYQKK